MFELISKFLKQSPSSKLPVCEPDLVLKKLPHDELRLIFDFLSLKELVKCRRVCKTFRSVVDSIRIRELLILANRTYYELYYEDLGWFHSDRPIHSKNSLVVRSPCWALRSSSFRTLGQNLKFLSFKYQLWGSNLELLNSFLWLEELWILHVEHCSNVKATLRLQNLKKIAFSLQTDTYYDSTLPWVVLDTPSLEDVRVERGLHLVQFKFGATVKRLQIGRCERTFELLEQFLELKNLEGFSCTYPAFLDAFDVLKFKPDLKRIECHRHKSRKQFDVKRLIERLLKQKAEWNLPVAIYFEGQLVNDMSDLRKFRLQNNA